MAKKTLKTNHLDIRKHINCVKNVSNRFGDGQLTVRNVLYQNNNSYAMSVMTINNTLIT